MKMTNRIRQRIAARRQRIDKLSALIAKGRR